MLELHLYGKLRKHAADTDPTAESILTVDFLDGDTVGSIIERIGIPQRDLGSNLFVNGRYADLSSTLQDGDRIGLFPDDMQLLYKWYFAPQHDAGASSQGSRSPNQDSAASVSGRASSQGSRAPNQDSGALEHKDEK